MLVNMNYTYFIQFIRSNYQYLGWMQDLFCFYSMSESNQTFDMSQGYLLVPLTQLGPNIRPMGTHTDRNSTN